MKRIKILVCLLLFCLSFFSTIYANKSEKKFLQLSTVFKTKPQKRINLLDQLIKRQNRIVIKSLFKARGSKKFYFLGLENAFTDLRLFNYVLVKELEPYIIEKYYLKNLSFWGLVFKKEKAFYLKVIQPNLDSYWNYPSRMRRLTFLSLKFLKSLNAKSTLVSKRKYNLVLKGYTDAFKYFNFLLKLLNENISEKEMSKKFNLFAKKLNKSEKHLFMNTFLQTAKGIPLQNNPSNYTPKNKDEKLQLFRWKILIKHSLGARKNHNDIVRPGQKRKKISYDYLKYKIKLVKKLKNSKKYKNLYFWLLNNDRFFLATKMLFLR